MHYRHNEFQNFLQNLALDAHDSLHRKGTLARPVASGGGGRGRGGGGSDYPPQLPIPKILFHPFSLRSY